MLRVIYQDIHDETYFDVRQPEDERELWECRVEFDSRQVFFITAPISVRPLYIYHRKFCERPERDGGPSCGQESEIKMRLRRQKS